MEFIAKISIDLINNLNYLQIHQEECSGFTKTQQHFKKFMKKDLLPSNGNPRNNHLILTRKWSSFVFNTALSHNININENKSPKSSNISQKSLILQLDSKYQGIPKTPFYFSMNFKHNTTNNNIDNWTNRIHTNKFRPKIYVPFLIGNFLSVDLTMELNKDINNYCTTNNPIENTTNYNFKLDMSSEFSKIFKISRQNIDSLKHSIKIKTTYEHKNRINSNPLESLSKDMEYKNSINYSITNYIFSKSKNSLPNRKNNKYSYKQVLYLNLEQKLTENSKNRHFSDIIGEISIDFNNKFLLHSYATLNTYNKYISSHTSEICAKNNKNNSIALGYLYRKNKIDLLKTTLGTSLNEKIDATLTYEYDYLKNKETSKSLEIRYNAQCWSTRIIYKNDKERNSKTIRLSIKLSGIGSNQNRVPIVNQNMYNNSLLDKKGW